MDASETVGEDSRGYDGGKSRDGRKRHILTDTEGLLLEVTVTTADVHDSKAAPALLETVMADPGQLLQLVWVDSAYQGPMLAPAFARHRCVSRSCAAPTAGADWSYWPAGGSWNAR